jgi:TolA-binding protein
MIPKPHKIVPWVLGLLLVCAGPLSQSLHAQRTVPSAERAYTSAVQLYHQRMYADAMSAFEAYRRTHPEQAQVGQSLYLEATAALARNQNQEAIRLFEQFQEAYPSHPRAPDAQLSLAQYFLEDGNVTAARNQLTAIVNNPASRAQAARALYLLGRSERDRGNLDQALTYFDQVRTRYGTTEVAPAAFYALGATQVELERYDQAAASFEDLGSQYPDSPYARNLGTALAEVYYRLGRYEQAASELRDRLSGLSGPQRARAHFLLAEASNQMRAGEEAVVHYRRVIDEHPQTPYVTPAKYGLAWHYQRANAPERAAQTFAEVRQSAAEQLARKALYYEAVNRAQLGDTDRALSLYQSVAESYPESRLAAEALFEAGLIRYRQGEHDAAAAFFRAITRDHPRAARAGDAYYWLGNAYLAGEDLDRALTAYDKATEYDAAPSSLLVEVRFQKAWAQYQEGRYAEAASGFMALVESAPETERGGAALFWGADSHFQQGEYTRARALFARYLEEYPDGDKASGARYALAWTYFKQNQYAAAARNFRQFLDTYPGGDKDIPYEQDARLRLADAYYALKRYEDAVNVYRRVGGEGTDYALYQSGEALNYAGRPDEAVRALDRLVQKYSESRWRPQALYRIGTIHFQQQEYEKAVGSYQRFLDAYPDHPLAPEAQYGIGDSHYNSGAMQEAVAAYRTVLVTYPGSETATEAASSLFFALSAAGQSDRAEEIIADIAAANPDANLKDRLRFQRAKAAYQSGESKKALNLFQSFVRTTSTSSLLPESYYYLGILYANQDQTTEAKNYLEQLIEQYPDSEVLPDGALRLGDIYLEEERFEEAAAAYRAAAESDVIGTELRAQARYGQSIALLNLDRNDEARDILNRVLENSQGGPLQASARLGLARIYVDEGRPDEAAPLYRSIVGSVDSETGAEALYRLGQLLRNQDNPREAIAELDRMSALYAGYPEWIARSMLAQAQAYRQLGQTGQAAQLYDEVIQSYPGTPFAETARNEREAL